MYEGFYGLNADPFRLSSDPRFCFAHRSYSRAKAYVQYALHRAEGFVMVTGRPGTGKTTLVNDLIATLPRKEVVVATLVSTQLEADDLLRMTAYAFGLDSDAARKSQVLQRLMEFFAQQHRQGLRTLLIIDEAQDLSISAMEELRLLTNLQRSGHPLLQIVLLGQESLRQLVHDPAMEQVHQRLIAAWHLEPLDPDETIGYVRHRLERADWRGDPAFQPGVLEQVYKFSLGVPRRINLVCSRLLLHGYISEKHELTPADALAVIEELKQEELASPDPAAADPSVTDATVRPPGEHTNWTEIDEGLYGPVLAEPTLPAAGEPGPTAPIDEPATETRETLREDRRQPSDVKPRPARLSADDHPAESPPRIVPEPAWRYDHPTGVVSDAEPARGRGGTGMRLAGWIALFLLLGVAALASAVLLMPGGIDSARVGVAASMERVNDWWQQASEAPPSQAGPPPPSGETARPSGEPGPEAKTDRVSPTFEPETMEPSPATQTAEPRAMEPPGVTQTAEPETIEPPPVTQAVEPDEPPPVTLMAEPTYAGGSPQTAEGSAPEPGPANVDGRSAGSGPVNIELERPTATDAAGNPGDPAPEPIALNPSSVPLVSGQVFFGWNSTEVEAEFGGLLDEVARTLEGFSEAYAEVYGYSDTVGNPDYNLVLSRQRAQSVANALMRRGVERDRLRVEGYGPRERNGQQGEPAPGDRMVEINVWSHARMAR